MEVRGVTPILNVSDLEASFEWFDKLGWSKHWEWCPPGASAPTYGAVTSESSEIFLCLDGQGGRGDQAVWMSVWVDDVDAVHEACLRKGLEVMAGPEEKPWGVREMPVRHPDGHMFRISTESDHH